MGDPQGIDVSSWQGNFDWQAWRGKLSFAMCKATEGLDFTDPDFAVNWNAMWALNRMMPRFAYCFFHPSQSPHEQAERLVALVREHGLLPGDNLVMDLEVTDGMEPGAVAEAGVAFLRAVNQLAPGHRVLVYTYPAFAQAGNCAGMGSWFLWLASYGVSSPAPPRPWSEWTFWQKTDSPIDGDVFNGTEARLLSFCRMPAKR